MLLLLITFSIELISDSLALTIFIQGIPNKGGIMHKIHRIKYTYIYGLIDDLCADINGCADLGATSHTQTSETRSAVQGMQI